MSEERFDLALLIRMRHLLMALLSANGSPFDLDRAVPFAGQSNSLSFIRPTAAGAGHVLQRSHAKDFSPGSYFLTSAVATRNPFIHPADVCAYRTGIWCNYETSAPRNYNACAFGF